jgi:capsular polysaccharide biosynthesis protein
VISVLSEFGIESVYPETMSFSDQVTMFNGAELIIGPSGAAWANTLFATSSCRGLCWTLQQYASYSVYSDISALVGMDLSYIWIPVDVAGTADAYLANYEVNLAELREAAHLLLQD